MSKNEDQDKENSQRDDKWWHPVVKVPPNGLSETSRRWLQTQKESVNQVLKAAMAINAGVLSEIEIPESYIDSLPKVKERQLPHQLKTLKRNFLILINILNVEWKSKPW